MDVVNRILVVDGEPQFRESLRRHLRRDGYLVESAPDTDQARNQIDRARDQGQLIDLVITGAFVPLLEGPELIRWVHRYYPGISTILMSDFGPSQCDLLVRPGQSDGYCGRTTSPGEMRKLIARIDFSRLAARMYGRQAKTM